MLHRQAVIPKQHSPMPIDTDATRRGNRGEDELALRETRQAHHPMLFQYLKGSV